MDATHKLASQRESSEAVGGKERQLASKEPAAEVASGAAEVAGSAAEPPSQEGLHSAGGLPTAGSSVTGTLAS